MIKIIEDSSQSKNSSSSFWNDNVAIQRMYSAITYLRIKDNQWKGQGSVVLVNLDPVEVKLTSSGKKKVHIESNTGESKDYSITSNMLSDSKGIASIVLKMGDNNKSEVNDELDNADKEL